MILDRDVRPKILKHTRCYTLHGDVIRGSVSNSKMESVQRCPVSAICTIDTARMNKFQQRYLFSNYNTMFCGDLQIPKYNLEYSKTIFSYTAPKIWDDIPVKIRSFLPCINQSKVILLAQNKNMSPIEEQH